MHQKFLHVCLFTFLLSYAFAVCAQGAGRSAAEEPERPPPLIGPIGGVNFASISVEPAEGLNLRMNTRATAGVAALLPIGGSKNQVQLELAYIGKGVKNELTDTTELIALDYLCLSPMLHLNVGKQPGFFLHVGPELGLLIKSKYTMETGGVRESSDIEERYSVLDLSIKVGAGVIMRVSRRLFAQANVTYSIGFVDILTGPGTGSSAYTTRGLQIHAALLVPLRKE